MYIYNNSIYNIKNIIKGAHNPVGENRNEKYSKRINHIQKKKPVSAPKSILSFNRDESVM